MCYKNKTGKLFDRIRVGRTTEGINKEWALKLLRVLNSSFSSIPDVDTRIMLKIK